MPWRPDGVREGEKSEGGERESDVCRKEREEVERKLEGTRCS